MLKAEEEARKRIAEAEERQVQLLREESMWQVRTQVEWKESQEKLRGDDQVKAINRLWIAEGQLITRSKQLHDEYRSAHPVLTAYRDAMDKITIAEKTGANMVQLGMATLDKFEEAMGRTVAMAVVMHQSIGAAMEQVLKSTLAELAGEAAVHAIKCLALGFELEAQTWGVPNPGSVMAFTAAAEWGALAAGAAIAGAVIPSGGRGGGGGGGYGGQPSARPASYGGGAGRGESGAGGGGGAGGGPGAAVHISYYGPVVTDRNSTQQLFDQWSQAAKDGSLWSSASSAVVQGPTATGRG
jgi:hypothetical protein